MEQHLDKLIGFAILVTVGIFVFFVLRRHAQQKDALARADEPLPLVETPVVENLVVVLEAPAAPIVAEPVVVADPAPIVPPEEIAIVAPPPAPMPPRQPKPKGPTPMDAALELLKNKDTRALALVLTEILGPPVSRRKRR